MFQGSGRHIALIPKGHNEGDPQNTFARSAGSYRGGIRIEIATSAHAYS